MDLQNVVNFTQRPRIVSRHPQDVALRMAVRRSRGISGSSGSQGISGLADSVAADAFPAGGGSTTTPSSGGLTTAQGIQLGTTIASSLAQIGTSIYSAQLAKQQAAQQAELQKKMLEVQKNQQSLEAYKLLASAQGRAVANGAGPVPATGDSDNGMLVIAAGVGLVALMMLR